MTIYVYQHKATKLLALSETTCAGEMWELIDQYDVPDPGEGGGGGGTTNYNALTNRPKIGGETVTGDQTLGKYGDLQDFFDVLATQAVALSAAMPKITMTKGSDTSEVSADTVKVTDGTDSVTATKAQLEVKNGPDVVTVKKNEVKATDGTDTMTATPLKVEVTDGTDVATIKKNEIKVTDGTDTLTETPLKVEVKDADETTSVTKEKVEVKKGAVISTIEDDRASMTDGTHTIAMSPVKATYGEHLKLDGDGVLESWEKVLGIGNFAVIEKTTASKAYAVGSYLLYNGTMYRVTKAISSGGTITTTGANANVEAKRVDEVIAELTAKDTAQDAEIAVVANAGAKNLLDVSRASAATLVVDSVAADGAISFKSTPTVGDNQCIAKATLKAGVTYKIVSDVVPTYGRIAAGVNATNMPTASGLYAPNITMISGGQSNAYLLRYNGSIKKSVFKSNADQDVYFWFAPDEGTAAVFTMRIMVCDNAITDDTYVPYAMSNAELTKIAGTIVDDKNMSGRVSGTSYTTNGITYTLNNDGSLTANGKATNHAYYYTNVDFKFRAGRTYRISSGLAPNTNGTSMQILVNGSAVNDTLSTGVATYTPTTDVTGDVCVVVRKDATVSNLKIYPMMMDTRIADTSYTPPVMSNAEITQELSDTGWVDFASQIPTNIFPAANVNTAKWRKKNGIVFVDLIIKPNVAFTKGQNTALATLPTEARISGASRMEVAFTGNFDWSQKCAPMLSINNTGVVNIYSPEAVDLTSGYMHVFATYPV